MLEINTSKEWLRVFSSIDFSKIPESDENDAADDFTATLRRKLEDAGFDVESAKGQRTLCHGWNGANTFSHKIGPVGTFDDLSSDEEDAIWKAIEDSEAEMIRDWSKSNDAQPTPEGGKYRVINTGSGEVLAVSATHDEAMVAADEAEDYEGQPIVKIQVCVDGEWVQVEG